MVRPVIHPVNTKKQNNFLGQLNTYKNVIQNDGDSDQMSFYNQFRDEWKKWIPAQQGSYNNRQTVTVIIP